MERAGNDSNLIEVALGRGLRIVLAEYPNDALEFSYEQLVESVLDLALRKLRERRVAERLGGNMGQAALQGYSGTLAGFLNP